MDEPRAQRTLVKSPPELWAEVSDVAALARHLGEFGEIRITRLEPETTVAWEGDRARGTVQLEPSGWGTKVTLTAELADVPKPAADAAEPEAVEEPEPPAAAAEPEAEPEAEAEPEPEPPVAESAPEQEPADEAGPEPEPDPTPAPEPEPRKTGFFARLFRRRHRVAEPAPPASVAAESEPPPPPTPIVEPVPDPEPVEQPEPEPLPPVAGAASEPEPEPAPEPEPEPALAPPAELLDGDRVHAILTGVLDDLGAARHRPFSRG
jgi:hypothetical protein